MIYDLRTQILHRKSSDVPKYPLRLKVIFNNVTTHWMLANGLITCVSVYFWLAILHVYDIKSDYSNLYLLHTRDRLFTAGTWV